MEAQPLRFDVRLLQAIANGSGLRNDGATAKAANGAHNVIARPLFVRIGPKQTQFASAPSGTMRPRNDDDYATRFFSTSFDIDGFDL